MVAANCLKLGLGSGVADQQPVALRLDCDYAIDVGRPVGPCIAGEILKRCFRKRFKAETSLAFEDFDHSRGRTSAGVGEPELTLTRKREGRVLDILEGVLLAECFDCEVAVLDDEF